MSDQTETAAAKRRPQSEMKGVMFHNDKGGVEARPDRRGVCTINGREYKISGWLRTGAASGVQYLSLAFTDNGAVEQPTDSGPPPDEPLPF